MRKETQERYLNLFTKQKVLTQKEVAAHLNVTIASASTVLRTLYERGTLRIIESPGMSKRYTLTKDFEVIRSVNGNPLYHLYDASLKESSPGDFYTPFAKTLVTHFLEREVSESDLREIYLPLVKNLKLLVEILANASESQIKATREALIESLGSENDEQD